MVNRARFELVMSCGLLLRITCLYIGRQIYWITNIEGRHNEEIGILSGS